MYIKRINLNGKRVGRETKDSENNVGKREKLKIGRSRDIKIKECEKVLVEW